jgi:hypothetical protein
MDANWLGLEMEPSMETSVHAVPFFVPPALSCRERFVFTDAVLNETVPRDRHT